MYWPLCHYQTNKCQPSERTDIKNNQKKHLQFHRRCSISYPPGTLHTDQYIQIKN